MTEHINDSNNVAPSIEADAREAERMFAVGAASTDLHLIYNAHGTPEDAERSVALVPADSLVFIEGFTDSGRPAYFQEALERLSDYRQQLGKRSWEYQEQRYRIMQACANGLDEPVYGPTDYYHHACMEIGSLLDKDCMVYYADYRMLDTTVYGANAARKNQLVATIATTADGESWREAAVNRGVGAGIRRLKAEARSWILGHAIREEATAHAVLLYTSYLTEHDHVSELLTTPEGKLYTSVLFGGGHMRSLTWQFRRFDIKPSVTQVNDPGRPIPEHVYLEPVVPGETTNIRRRMAHRAITALAIAFHEDIDSGVEFANNAYRPLGVVNKMSDEEWAQFLVTAVDLVKDVEKGDEPPLARFLSLYRMVAAKKEDYMLPPNERPMLG